MIERVLENWLINASERAFQTPFCQVLVNQGYTVVHLTRHCSMEMGKDIIAIAPDGTPTAFQLKATGRKKISKEEWRTVLLPQVEELVTQAIEHPAIGSTKAHHPVLVINGELEEEAQVAIKQYNEGLRRRNFSKTARLEVIVRGQLLSKFLELGENLVPSELKDEKALLELYLMKGNEIFPKEKFARLLESILPLTDSKMSKAGQRRTMTAAAIVTALSLSSFNRVSNHVAGFEAWTIFCAYILCLAEKRIMPKKQWEPVFLLGYEAMLKHLEDLSDELAVSKNYIEGDPIADVPFYRIRLTHLAGLMALLGICSKTSGRSFGQEKQFISSCHSNLFLWGEYAIPQFLAQYWFTGYFDSTLKPAHFLGKVLAGVAKLGGDPNQGYLLPGPQVDPEEYVLDTHIRPKNERKNSYNGRSTTIEGLLHLYVRYNLKQTLSRLWPDISKVQRRTFLPTDKKDYYMWHIERGHEHSFYPQPTQSWVVLRDEAKEHAGDDLPKLLKKYPEYCLAFLLVYPHRFTPSLVRWLDTVFQDR